MILQLAISVGIEGLKDIDKLLMLRVHEARVIGHVGEHSLLHLLLDINSMNVLDDVLHHRLLELVGHMLLSDGSILKDPLIIQGLLCTDAFVRVVSQHLFNHHLGFPGHHNPFGLGKLEFASTDLIENLSMVFALKGWLPAQQDVHNDAAAPNITLFIIHPIEDFGGNIVRGAELMLHFRIWVENYRGPKIDDLDEIYLVRFYQ